MSSESKKVVEEKVIDGIPAKIYEDGTVETPEFSYKVQNTVASVELELVGVDKLDLNQLEENLKKIKEPKVDVRYQPKQFPGLVLKIQTGGDIEKVSCLVFTSGKMVVTGVRRPEKMEEAVKIVLDVLKKAGAQIGDNPKIKIQNMVASGDLKAKIDLELAALRLEENAMYEPEQFPGLIYRFRIVKPECDERYEELKKLREKCEENPLAEECENLEEERRKFESECMENVAVLLFHSGKVVCTGAKTEDVIFRAIKETKKTVKVIEALQEEEEGL